MSFFSSFSVVQFRELDPTVDNDGVYPWSSVYLLVPFNDVRAYYKGHEAVR